MENDQELGNQTFTFCNQGGFVQVDNEVVFSGDLEIDDLGFLVFVDPLSEHESSLSVSLTPFLSFSVIKWKSDNTFSQLVHDIAPEHLVNVSILHSK